MPVASSGVHVQPHQSGTGMSSKSSDTIFLLLFAVLTQKTTKQDDAVS